jgi:hypothetical protein
MSSNNHDEMDSTQKENTTLKGFVEDVFPSELVRKA